MQHVTVGKKVEKNWAPEGVFMLLLAVCVFVSACSDQQPRKPNFLIITPDDVGFSDLGFVGSEIRTPNIDRLAAHGAILTTFYTAPNCSPTRAMLMSGADNHAVGLGIMAELMHDQVRGKPGYEGYLIDGVYTLPERLRDHGYNTYMAGKWHLGTTRETSAAARGFDRSFTMLQGGASHYSDMKGIFSHEPRAHYREDYETVDTLPENFFSSTFYADKIIEYIEADSANGKPFFAWLAFTAPHWPLQAPDGFIDRYENVYDDGWDVLRERRLEALKNNGFVAPHIDGADRLARVPAWNDLSKEEQTLEARRMELYAAMIEHLDHEIGRVLSYLEQKGELENTYVVFFSDNGPEGNYELDIFDNAEWVPKTFDNSFENLGRQGSYLAQGPGWAQVSAVPMRMFKAFPTEGGIRNLALISHAGGKVDNRISEEWVSVKDIAPTILDIVGAPLNAKRGSGNPVIPITGQTILPMLANSKGEIYPERSIGFELFGRKALRKGKWKILSISEPYGTGNWQLYDLEKDPVETEDLAAIHPEKLQELIAEWDGYVSENGVIEIKGEAAYGK